MTFNLFHFVIQDRINRQIDATQNETEEVEKKLAHALDEEKKAQSLIRCKTKSK